MRKTSSKLRNRKYYVLFTPAAVVLSAVVLGGLSPVAFSATAEQDTQKIAMATTSKKNELIKKDNDKDQPAKAAQAKDINYELNDGTVEGPYGDGDYAP